MKRRRTIKGFLAIALSVSLAAGVTPFPEHYAFGADLAEEEAGELLVEEDKDPGRNDEEAMPEEGEGIPDGSDEAGEVTHLFEEETAMVQDELLEGIGWESVYEPESDEETELFVEETDAQEEASRKNAAGAWKVSGTCGEDVRWSFDTTTGEMVISGTGAMTDYTYSTRSARPYDTYKTSVTKITIEEGVTSVGSYAFSDFEALQEIHLAESVAVLGDRALMNCYALETLYLPADVSMQSVAYLNSCDSLRYIDVAEDSRKYMSKDGVLYSKNGDTLLAVPVKWGSESLVIPDTVREIAEGAICSTRYIRYIYVGQNVQTLKKGNFNFNSSLEKIAFQGSEAPSRPTSAIFRKYYGEKITIYCDLSVESWQSFRDAYSDNEELIWEDCSLYKGMDTLSIYAEKDTLEIGEQVQLEARLNPVLALGFRWESSDPAVASVTEEGMLCAYTPGKTVVTAESLDGVYRAQKVFEVSEAEQEPAHMEELETGIVDYTYAGYEVQQIPVAAKCGIYFLNQSKLSFYSLRSKTYRTVYTFKGCTRAYSDGTYLYVVSGEECTIYNLLTDRVEHKLVTSGYTATAVGADASGRIYIAAKDNDSQTAYILLYSREGALLSRAECGAEVYRFNGFDSATGNFYMERYSDFVYEGNSQQGRALMAGNVTNNEIRMGSIDWSADGIMYLSQDSSYYAHQNNAALMGDRYLIGVSSVTDEVCVWDIQNQYRKVLSIARTPLEEGNYSYMDVSSIGVRAVYYEPHNSMIIYENNCLVTEYDLASGKALASYQTSHPVFNMFWVEDSLVCIEKDGDQYYVESVQWKDPTELQVIYNDTMRVGDLQQIVAQTDTSQALKYTWTSSDRKTASVTETGEVSAWKTGEVTITVADASGKFTKYCTITIVDNGQTENESMIQGGAGGKNNIEKNNYYTWSGTVESYIYERSDGTLETIEYVEGNGVTVQTYTKSGSLLRTASIAMELPIFGGFFAGAEYHFLVFGQNNPDENDAVEIMRVVKYTKDWQRLAAFSAYGDDTCTPFDAGSLRMTEVNQNLYIHTCHEMYMSSDGLHHQSNMTYMIDETSMTQGVLNTSVYASHSFNQFIQTDGKYVYYVDHGDAYPRGVRLIRTGTAEHDSLSRETMIYPIKLGVTGQNTTGVSIGGFELSGQNCLLVGNSVDQDNGSLNGNRNIFLAVADKQLKSTNTIWLTKHADGSGVSVNTPQLVKLNEQQFLLMWEESDLSGVTNTKMCTVDGNGNLMSEITSSNLPLSDCQPVLTSDGLVRWYVSDGYQRFLCSVNPYLHTSGKQYTFCLRDHVWDEGVIIRQATKAENGIRRHTCLKCGSLYDEEVQYWDPGWDLTWDFDDDDFRFTPAKSDTEEMITSLRSDSDLAESAFGSLQAKAVKVKKTSLRLTWKRVSGASTYTVYGAKCGKNNPYQKIASVSGTGYTVNKLKKGTYYKYMIVAEGSSVKAFSKTIHVATSGKKVGNHTKVTVNKKKVALKKGKKVKIKAKAVAGKLKVKKHRNIAYESSNPGVASVSAKGVVTAKKKGKCVIYAYAQNGVCTQVKVTVK